MARNRVIYQSESLYVSEGLSSATAVKHEQLTRVQSANYSFSINRQDINEFGSLARLDSIIMEAPTVSLDFSYYLTEGFNEKALGFSLADNLNTQFLAGHMGQTSGKNFFITTAPEGQDANGVGGTTAGNKVEAVIGFGNAFLSDYSVELAVGSLPTASVSLECANMRSVAGSDISGTAGLISGMDNPAVDITNGVDIGGEVVLPAHSISGEESISALQPGDVTINIEELDGVTFTDISGVDDENAINIQSASLSIPLSRSPIDRLGTRFPYSRSVDFPLNATLSVNGVVSDVQAKNLSSILTTNSKKNITLTLKSGSTEKLVYRLKGCRVDSESFSSSIGSNKSVDIVFSTQVGGTNDTSNGVFVSGDNGDTMFA